MNALTINTTKLLMSSREIAELVEQRHDNVKRTIETLGTKGVIALPQIEEVPNMGPGPKTIGVFHLGKRDSLIVVAQLCPEFTARIVDRWQELEAQAAVQQFNIPTTLSSALMLAARQAEQIEQQQAQLALAAPKVAFVEQYVESTGLKGFREVAKLLKANEARFREFLVERKVMYRLNGEWTAHQQHIAAGRFAVKTGTSEGNGHAFTRSLFTPKGLEWVAGLWAVHCLRGEAEK
jgi:phage antirepressor YoqD-like protein